MQALVALWVVTVVVFGLTRVSGDPLDTFLSEEATPEQIERMRVRWGLDKPLVVQYGVFLSNAFKGDLGDSLKYPGSKAGTIVMERMPPTLQLAGVAMAIALIIAIPVRVLSAVKKDSVFDYVGKTLALAGQSVPSFWMGIVLM